MTSSNIALRLKMEGVNMDDGDDPTLVFKLISNPDSNGKLCATLIISHPATIEKVHHPAHRIIGNWVLFGEKPNVKWNRADRKFDVVSMSKSDYYLHIECEWNVLYDMDFLVRLLEIYIIISYESSRSITSYKFSLGWVFQYVLLRRHIVYVSNIVLVVQRFADSFLIFEW